MLEKSSPPETPPVPTRAHAGHTVHMKTALNPQPTPDVSVSFCSELPSGPAPEWVELIPAGPTVIGRDGRSWTFGQAEAQTVLAAFAQRAAPLPLDWEHATEHRAPVGLDAPAAAWIKELDVRDGALWGRVDWNTAGREHVESGAYKFLSPVFLYTAEDRRILEVKSVGLTNRPNFKMTALNHESQETDMDWSKLLAALGLGANASPEEALTAFNTKMAEKDDELQTAKNQQGSPSLEKFVPRADYDAVVVRAANAETKLKDAEAATLEAAIQADVDAACEKGLITPATKGYYTAQCRQEGGLDAFREFVKVAPPMAGGSGLDGKVLPGGGTEMAMNAEQRQIADVFGNSAEDLAKYGQQ